VVAEVLAGDGERAASVGIGLDGLGVGEIQDDEKDQNRCGDGTDEVDAADPQRNKEGERGFRAVCGGTEGVEAEDGNAGSRANVLGAFVRCGERSSEEQVSDLPAGLSLRDRVIVSDLLLYCLRC
jgi:hypothetical protein